MVEEADPVGLLVQRQQHLWPPRPRPGRHHPDCQHVQDSASRHHSQHQSAGKSNNRHAPGPHVRK